MVKVPSIQDEEPPATKLLEKSPVVPFTGATDSVDKTMLGLKTRRKTDEFGPGAG